MYYTNKVSMSTELTGFYINAKYACFILQILRKYSKKKFKKHPLGHYHMILCNKSVSFKKYGMLHKFACHPCAGAMLISALFHFNICAAKVSTEISILRHISLTVSCL